jgi:E3 ubiquitin-protein ligase RNF146
MTPTPVPPTNTPQTPAGGTASGDTTPDRRESLHRAVEQIRSLSLRDNVAASDESDGDERGSGDEHQELPDFSGVVPSPWVLTFSSDEDQL